MTKHESVNEAGPLLTVLAALLLDTVLRFEETAGCVSDLVTRNGRPDREVIVTLQSFDRIKQEFEALCGALFRYAEQTAEAPLAGEQYAQFVHEIISSITVADLKDRLLHRLQHHSTEVESPKLSPVDAGEVDIDVVF